MAESAEYQQSSYAEKMEEAMKQHEAYKNKK